MRPSHSPTPPPASLDELLEVMADAAKLERHDLFEELKAQAMPLGQTRFLWICAELGREARRVRYAPDPVPVLLPNECFAFEDKGPTSRTMMCGPYGARQLLVSIGRPLRRFWRLVRYHDHRRLLEHEFTFGWVERASGDIYFQARSKWPSGNLFDIDGGESALWIAAGHLIVRRPKRGATARSLAERIVTQHDMCRAISAAFTRYIERASCSHEAATQI